MIFFSLKFSSFFLLTIVLAVVDGADDLSISPLRTANVDLSLKSATPFVDVQWLAGSISDAVAVTSDGRVFSTHNAAQTWTEHTADLPQPIASIVANPVPPYSVYALDADVSAWFSADFGRSFRRAADRILDVEFNIHFPDAMQIAELRASAGCGLAQLSGEACFTELFLSSDGGATFQLLLSYVEKVRFSAKHRDSIFVSTFLDRRGAQQIKNPVDNVLLRLDNIRKPKEIEINVITHGAAAFLHAGDFFLVARYASATATTGGVVMMVSRDDDLFADVQFRGNTVPLQFTVLAASNQSLVLGTFQPMAQPADPLYKQYGQLFVSDASGTRMKLVNPRLSRTETHTYDFSAIDAAHGVFVANQVAAVADRNGSDSVVTSVVSIDGGSSWQPISFPMPGMTLVHRDSDERAVFATGNAPGVVFATGKLASTSASMALVSYDFGLSWQFLLSPDAPTTAEVHMIPSLSLVLAVGDAVSERLAWARVTGVVDNGTDAAIASGSISFWTQAWPGNVTLTSPNFFVARNESAMVALVVARNNGTDLLVRVSFDQISLPACTDADFGRFSLVPPSGAKCPLGRELAVRRLLDNATTCVYARAPISERYIETPCACTLADFQCDVGFDSPTNSPPCTLVVDTPPRECLAPNTYNRTSVRRIPGNLCVVNDTEEIGLPAPVEIECPATFNCECGDADKNGDCIAHGVCRCDEGWAGRQCNQPLFECQNSSCVHGKCTNVIHCECDDGYGGLDCSARNVPEVPDIDSRLLRRDGLTGVEIFFIVAGVVAGLSLLIGFIAMIYLRFYGGRRYLHMREDAEGASQASNREVS
jgi:hypothetical protein